MINAVLYSDQIIPENSGVDFHLVAMMQHTSKRIGYIPSGPDPDLRFFNEKKAYYARYDLDLPVFYDLDLVHSRADLDDLLACSAIHLSGGNTVAFLNRLRFSGMLAVLRHWAESGGILIGASAGAILMTPTIAVDALFSGDRPEDMKDGVALDLLPFEFFPHINTKPSYLTDLLQYSTSNPRPVVACPDGDGIIVRNGKVMCVGNPTWLSEGRVKQVEQLTLFRPSST